MRSITLVGMEPTNTNQPTNSFTATVVSVIILIVIIAGIVALTFSGRKGTLEDAKPIEPTDTTANTSPAATSTPTTPAPAATSTAYKDGTYTAKGTYTSPAGPEAINVTLTIKDDIITSATVVSLATNVKSITMQGQFIAGFKTQVIGKDISTLKVSKVSGSSLTPLGFNAALEIIKAEAKA